MKVCPNCKKELPEEDYYKRKNGNPIGRCKACRSLYSKEKYRKFIESLSEQELKEYREKMRLGQTKYREEDGGKRNNANFKKWHSKPENRLKHNARRIQDIDYKLEKALNETKLWLTRDQETCYYKVNTDEKRFKRFMHIMKQHAKRKGYKI